MDPSPINRREQCSTGRRCTSKCMMKPACSPPLALRALQPVGCPTATSNCFDWEAVDRLNFSIVQDLSWICCESAFPQVTGTLKMPPVVCKTDCALPARKKKKSNKPKALPNIFELQEAALTDKTGSPHKAGQLWCDRPALVLILRRPGCSKSACTEQRLAGWLAPSDPFWGPVLL